MFAKFESTVDMAAPQYDVVVIGAGNMISSLLLPNLFMLTLALGLSGIATARFYLDTHPECKLLILEGEAVVGGVWSSSMFSTPLGVANYFNTIITVRSYKDFWSQSGLRMTGFSDVPLKLPEGADMYHDTFEAKYVTKYLEEYIDSHVYSWQTLRDRILFGFQVQGLRKANDIWIVEGGDEDSRIIHASKIVVATGHMNIPKMPSFVDQDRFQGRIVHHKEFGQVSRNSSSPYTEVAVLGGGKSAADMVYDSVKAGKKVSWIIRKRGEGPAGVTSRGRYKNGAEMVATRFFAGLSPSCFTPKSWWTKLIHKSALCRFMIKKIWKGADRACAELANFNSRPGALPGFENLRPHTDIF